MGATLVPASRTRGLWAALLIPPPSTLITASIDDRTAQAAPFGLVSGMGGLEEGRPEE